MEQKTGGKAQGLKSLSQISGVRVPRFISLSPDIALTDCRDRVEEFISANPDCIDVAVRSSSDQEDGMQASFAGMFLSKLHVPARCEDILKAILEVRDSGMAKKLTVDHYASARGFSESSIGVGTIVQEMVHADIAGVIFSHSLDTDDGYFLISVTSGLGDQVASGLVNGSLIRIERDIAIAQIPEKWLRDLIVMTRAIEEHMHSNSLDVEFAVAKEVLFCLQCRPLTTMGSTKKIDAQSLQEMIKSAQAEIADLRADDVLGDMIDINPLELLGADPSTLDISVFRFLFSDRIVEAVRETMGYHPLHCGLVQLIAGKPYVSLRASAFSFRPRGICDATYEKLVSTYCELIRNDESRQSRVEFDVFAMDTGDKLESRMRDAELNTAECEEVRCAFITLRSSLFAISETVAAQYEARLREYAEAIKRNASVSLENMLSHVAEGTRFFVQVARLAFYWKNRFEETYPAEDLNELLAGHIETVSSRQEQDLIRCRSGEISRSELVRTYGHLRPGQFSMFGESYADDPEHYLFSQVHSERSTSVPVRAHAFKESAEFKNVVAFMRAREESKFLFSRALSQFIDTLKRELTLRGIPKEVAKRCVWNDLHAWINGLSSGVLDAHPSVPLNLPSVVFPRTCDLRIVRFGRAAPTFITRQRVKAPILVLEDPSIHCDVSGAIVVIPNADPGFDYLFHSGAVGIITKNGGPASHMCIRAVELQMPACIGCGEHQFSVLRSVQALLLDCSSRQLVAC